MAGLAVPGLSLALRRQWVAAAWSVYAVVHLLALAWADATAVVQRFDGDLLAEPVAVAWIPVRFGPQAGWALALALSVHVLAAWSGARSGVAADPG